LSLRIGHIRDIKLIYTYNNVRHKVKITSAKCIEDSAKCLILHQSISVILNPSINKFKSKKMMSSNVSNQSGNSYKIWKQIFMVFILIQAAGELAIGFTLLFNLPMAMENFNTPYAPDMEVLGLTLGLYLFLLTTLMVLSFIWIRKSNRAGVTLGIIIGLFLISFGVGMLVKFGQTQALWVDGFRGGLTVLLAYMAGKSMKYQKLN